MRVSYVSQATWGAALISRIILLLGFLTWLARLVRSTRSLTLSTEGDAYEGGFLVWVADLDSTHLIRVSRVPERGKVGSSYSLSSWP